MIGERLKHAFTGNSAWILSYRDECFDQIGLKATTKIPLFNGALECQFRHYEIFDGKYKEFRAEGEELSKDRKEAESGKKAAFKEKREFKPRERFQKDKKEFGDKKREFKPREKREFKNDQKKDFRPRERKSFGGDRERQPRSGESYPERKRREAKSEK